MYGFIQVFSLVTGIVYLALQVFQHKWMWYFGLMTAGAALAVSLFNKDACGVWAPLWAQVAMNAFFFVMDIAGILSWNKMEAGIESQAAGQPLPLEAGIESQAAGQPLPPEAGIQPGEAGKTPLHLVKITRPAWIGYVVLGCVSAPVICTLLSHTNDPMPIADGLSMSLSIVAQVMLIRSNLENWYFWFAADAMVMVIYALQEAWWMVLLYFFYVASCVVGLLNWRRRGVYAGQ